MLKDTAWLCKERFYPRSFEDHGVPLTALVHGERLVDEIGGGVPGAAGVLLLEVLLALEAEGGVERLEQEEKVLRVVADGCDEVVHLEHLRLDQGLERDLGDLVAETHAFSQALS